MRHEVQHRLPNRGFWEQPVFLKSSVPHCFQHGLVDLPEPIARFRHNRSGYRRGRGDRCGSAVIFTVARPVRRVVGTVLIMREPCVGASRNCTLQVRNSKGGRTK